MPDRHSKGTDNGRQERKEVPERGHQRAARGLPVRTHALHQGILQERAAAQRRELLHRRPETEPNAAPAGAAGRHGVRATSQRSVR